MASKTTIERRLQFRRSTLERLYEAYDKLLKGGVKSYTIDDRELTRFDLPDLKEEIEKMEKEVDELENQLNGRRPRKAVAVVLRDW